MRYFIFFCLIINILFSEEQKSILQEDLHFSLCRDLVLVEEIHQQIHDSLPFLFNYQLQGGYFTMPSARMAEVGTLGFSFSYLPPYRLYNLMFQFFSRLEITGNYWLLTGIQDPTFGGSGFGTFSDRAANVKFALLQKRDGIENFPEIAIGWNDFIGSQRFSSFFVVGTKEFLNLNLEVTLGWGNGRIQGFFGGVGWSPFRKFKQKWLNNLTLKAEYDANNYKEYKEEHPKGKGVKVPVNLGIEYQLFDIFRLQASTIRGKDIAASASISYNLGKTTGIFPKIYDPPIYTNPINIEPIGVLRSKREVGQELAYAFQSQGFDLYNVIEVVNQKREDTLWLKVVNVRYRFEENVQNRILNILASLLPENIKEVTVVIEADGLDVYQYKFHKAQLERYRDQIISEKEVHILSSMKEVTERPNIYDGYELYRRNKSIWLITFNPRFQNYWGSSTGKFKYDAGFSLGPQGYLFNQMYYDILLSYIISSSSSDMGDRDILNPSQIINVRSDFIRYQQSNSFHVDKAYFQRSWNLKKGWFSRSALGYFEIAYAGMAQEFLYYPVHSNWAIGAQAAVVFKRKYSGLGFQKKIRKLQGIEPTYLPFIGFQYFLDIYYDFKPLNLDFKVSFGQFLAKDKGVKINVARTFQSGLRVGLWYTFTNGKDEVNGKRYFDKGISLSIPIDIFMNQSSRSRLGYGMAAWLRDVGAKAQTGKELYPTIYFERYNQNPTFY